MHDICVYLYILYFNFLTSTFYMCVFIYLLMFIFFIHNLKKFHISVVLQLQMVNQILGLLRRNVTYKEKEQIVPLYKALVRPHLEYSIQVWRPYHKKDIDAIERIQRRATKMIPQLRNLSYEERLKECGLTTLETMRLRGDQVEVFKILNGYENIDRNNFVLT